MDEVCTYQYMTSASQNAHTVCAWKLELFTFSFVSSVFARLRLMDVIFFDLHLITIFQIFKFLVAILVVVDVVLVSNDRK